MYFQPFGFNTIKNLASGRIGSWGTPELGWSEAVADLTGAGRNAQGGSANTQAAQTFVSAQPNLTAQQNLARNQSGVPLYQYDRQLGPAVPGDVLGANTGFGGGSGNGSGGSQSNSFGIIPDVGFEERLRSQRSTLDSILNRARGVFDEGMGALSSKRQQFKEAFDQGKEDILQEGQRAKGEAQTSAQGARTRNANALRALGLGGSALVNTKGREAQNEAKTLAGINDQIGLNTRQNQGAYNANLDWANAQESSLNRYLQDAQLARQAGENQINEGLFDYINNLASNQLAQAASRIGGYEVNPYQANVGDFTDSINSLVSGITGGQEGNDNVSIDPNYLSTIFKRLRGVQ